jgi:hypothetical protein
MQTDQAGGYCCTFFNTSAKRPTGKIAWLALETIDLATLLLKNHLGSYECKLCLTLHIEALILSHTSQKTPGESGAKSS